VHTSNATEAPDAELKPGWPGGVAAAELFRSTIVQWFERHGRALPWRRTHDAYAILVSEFMLQQTQVTTVIDYYARWMARFPSFAALAAASEQDVLSVWQGLGYYSRAKNLHRAAKVVTEDFGGELPRSLAALRALPGVGDYTAAAVAAFAWDEPVPVVDANIARVLARLTNWQERIDTSAGREFLKTTAAALQPVESGGRLFNSALMELGALVCRSGQPNCLLCPVCSFCTTAVPAALPVKAPRAATAYRQEQVAFVFENNQVFLMQSQGPRWRGLWHMPPTAIMHRAPDHSLEYAITRYKVRLDVIRLPRQHDPLLTAFPVVALDALPMPAPHRRALGTMLAST